MKYYEVLGEAPGAFRTYIENNIPKFKTVWIVKMSAFFDALRRECADFLSDKNTEIMCGMPNGVRSIKIGKTIYRDIAILNIGDLNTAEIYDFLDELYNFAKINNSSVTSIGRTAMDIYRRVYFPFYNFKSIFPKLSEKEEHYCRVAYAGGWCYKRKECRYIEYGRVYDVNSLYPYVMSNYPMPYGKARNFENKDLKNSSFYIIKFSCNLKLKPGALPFVTAEKYTWKNEGHYIENTNFPVTLIMSRPDYERMFKHYHVTDLVIKCGFSWDVCNVLFDDYIKSIEKRKRAITYKPRRLVYKLLLNSLYGQFGRKKINMVDIWKDDHFEQMQNNDYSWSYVPVAVAVVAYARDFILGYAQKMRNRWIYSDTDSLHIIGRDPVNLPISDKMGDFKLEAIIDKGCYMKPRKYAYRTIEAKTKIVFAGFPTEYANMLDYDKLMTLSKLPFTINYIGRDGYMITEKRLYGL